MTTTTNNEHKKLNFSSEREQSQACLNSAEHEKNQGRKVLNVPNLRFPEFQGEWKNTTIGEIATIKNGPFGSVLHAEDYVDEGMPIVTTEHFKSGNLPLSKNGIPQVSEDDYCRLKGYRLETDDIVFSRVGSVDINAHVEHVQQGWLFSGRVLRVRPIKSVNSLCLHYVLSTESVKRDIRNRAVGQTMPSINTPILSNTGIYMSQSEAEQKKIANLLSLIDERIATQNKIIEDLKKLKSAIIEKLYSEIQGKEYSYRQLFDVVNERNKQMEYSNILSASQEKGMINRDDLNLDIQFERSNINTYKIVRAGDYVIHLRSFQGGFAFSDKSGVCSPAYTILRPNSFLEYSYLSNYFTSQRFIKSLIIVTYGIRDGRSINVDEWLSMKITIPSKEHQQYIVKIIGSFDRKIESEEAYTILLSKQKQYILRQMFI